MALNSGRILFDKYSIKGSLGSGGWGEVYLAEDLQLGRLVAVKHLKADWACDDTILQRFLQEAQIIASLKNPQNIVIIHGLECEGDEHYIIEEYADQGTVSDIMRESDTLPIDLAVDIAIALCSALEVVHRKGIVHRDIKPSNILLFEGPDGGFIPKLCDFGIARVPRTQDEQPLTEVGTLLGTAQYMAPEQIEGKPVDERSDIYSLGAVLYEMLTGENLFTGGTWDILTSHVAQDPVPPSELRPTITPTLNDLVLRCLAKSPDDRIQTTREVREVLEVVRQEEAERLTQVGALFDHGAGHLERGEWREAASFFRKVIAANQNHAEAAQLLEEAETQLKQQEAERQQKAQSLYDQGLAHMQKESFQEAAACFEEALTLAPDHIDVNARLEDVKQKLYETGVEHLEREEPQKAVDRFVTLVSLDVRYRDVAEKLEEARRQHNLDILYIQGMGYTHNQQWEMARAKFHEIRQVDPDYRDVANVLEEIDIQEKLAEDYQRGVVAFEAQNWSSSVACFGDIVAIDPDYEDAQARLDEAREQHQLSELYTQGLAHFDRQEWAAAIDTLQQVLALRQDYEDAAARLEEAEEQQALREQYERAVQYECAGEWKTACQAYVDIVRAVSPYPYRDAAERLAKAQHMTTLTQWRAEADRLWAAGKWPAAIARLEETSLFARQHKDLGREIHRELAARTRRARKTLKPLQAALESGQASLAAGDWAPAAEAFRQVLASSPEHPEAIAGLGQAEEAQAHHLSGPTAHPVPAPTKLPAATVRSLNRQRIAWQAALAGLTGLVLAYVLARFVFALNPVRLLLMVGGSVMVSVALILIRQALAAPFD